MMVSNIVKLRVILHPAAKNTCITDFINDTEPIVKISVSEIPENGKANEALIKLLSKTLNIAKTDILIKNGFKTRKKLLYINNITIENLINKLQQFVPKLTLF